MTWNNGNSILGTAQNSKQVVNESDVIFTALFVGVAALQQERFGGKKSWRMDMEPNLDEALAEKRTNDDKKSMATLNRVCSKVNFVLDWKQGSIGAISWGLTPSYDRGGMILGGENAAFEYDGLKKEYLAFAFRYLTAAHRHATHHERSDEMYIGRGAYCGLVIDDEGNAVTAMSTVRSTLNEKTDGAGSRWKPGLDAQIRATQYEDEAKSATWGIIRNQATQDESKAKGMRFFPRTKDGEDIPLNADTDIVSYTHGMIRSMYEVERIGKGNPFEMSIGVETYKLASCIPCSTFMLANDIDASSTHLGRGESWAPLFNGESNSPSYYPDREDPPDGEITIAKAIKRKNAKHSAFMHRAMKAGVDRLLKASAWVNPDCMPALEALTEHLKVHAKDDNTVARDLFLDSLTIHKSDVSRIDGALTIPSDASGLCEKLDWVDGKCPELAKTWRNWETRFSDADIAKLHTLPDITYRITAYSDAGARCDLEFSLIDEARRGGDRIQFSGKLQPAVSDPTKWFFEFAVPYEVVVESWRIKIGRAAEHTLRLDENTVIDSTHSYIVNSLSR